MQLSFLPLRPQLKVKLGWTVMLESDRNEVEKYIENLLGANDLDDLDSWMQIISTAEFASSTNNPHTAESLYKLALQFAEQRMSTEVVINALLFLSTVYKKEHRMIEAQTAYERAIALFEVSSASQQFRSR